MTPAGYPMPGGPMNLPPSERRVAAMREAALAKLPADLRRACESLAPRCNWLWNGHEQGRSGCNPDAPATHVIHLTWHCGMNGKSTLFLVCEAQYGRLVEAAAIGGELECGLCHATSTIANTIAFHGRLADYIAKTTR